ncbi:hypothetical protein T265_05706 [Opisthorchis viverrini]|uniref:Uncharacterized protein n=1 Tax=Opisthorchis viverrini TaxID=6198 RepID=A0A074ZJM5_OPIVI|nr:hypothetical protein T265_05706 [Opisthorchis viverrini]KER27171.1 hypothetical protein T265_05706 [Opisthorchis viverrini]
MTTQQVSSAFKKKHFKHSLSTIKNRFLRAAKSVTRTTKLVRKTELELPSAQSGVIVFAASFRSCVFWPGTDEHMEQICRSFFRCAAAQRLPN